MIVTQAMKGLHVLNSLATLLVRHHAIVAVIADERSVPKAANIIVCPTRTRSCSALGQAASPPQIPAIQRLTL